MFICCLQTLKVGGGVAYLYLSVSVDFNIFCFMALQILAGTLQLGNVNFSSSSDESQPCNLDEQSKGIG